MKFAYCEHNKRELRWQEVDHHKNNLMNKVKPEDQKVEEMKSVWDEIF